MSPLVSIIIPCFNAKPWLAETLASALGQTYPHREIIFVDDGSRDGSLEVARRYEPQGLTTIVSQANQGASSARNCGLRQARGDYIQFLDADDLLSPDKIERQIDSLQRRAPRSVGSCRWGRFHDGPSSARFTDEAVFRDFQPIDFLLLSASTGAMMHPAAWLTPRSVIDAAGFWNETLSLNDDGEFFCRVLLASDGVVFSDEGKAFYRSGRPGTLSQQRHDQARRSQFRSIELITGHLQRAETSDRIQKASANLYQRFIYDYYPSPPELMAAAAARVDALGGSSLREPLMGRKTAWLARILGWKNVRRLKARIAR